MGQARTTAILATLIATSSGCATMFGGVLQEVTIRTDPPDATVIVDGEIQGSGISRLRLARGVVHELRVEHPGHEPASVTLDTGMNAKSWLNLMLLPLFWVGFGVDAVTGAIASVVPNRLDITLDRESSAAPPPIPVAARRIRRDEFPRTRSPPSSMTEAPPASPRTAEGPQLDWVIAVMDVASTTAPALLTVEEQRGLGDHLRAFLAARRLKVVDRGVQERALAEIVAQEKVRSYAVCVDDQCQIPLGRALAATHVLRATVARFGGLCSTAVELVELRREVAVAAAAARSPCVPEAILGATERIADALVDQSR